jgi:hypothetical protein
LIKQEEEKKNNGARDARARTVAIWASDDPGGVGAGERRSRLAVPEPHRAQCRLDEAGDRNGVRSMKKIGWEDLPFFLSQACETRQWRDG